jgi:chaperonin GroEL
MATRKENRVIVRDKAARAKILEGARGVYQTVASTYGPRGMNVLIEQTFGRPVVTRDGVTVARAIYFSDRAKNVGAQVITEASETTNRIAGDATSATAVLSGHLLENSYRAIDNGMHPMDVSAILKRDHELILERIEELGSPVSEGQLEQVATVSSGDPLLGRLIAEAIEYVGPDGGIISEKAPVNSVEREYVDGYYIQSGFGALQSGKKELIDPTTVVCIRPVKSRADAFELLENIAKSLGIQPGSGVIPRILFIGNIEEDAYVSLVDAINRGVIDGVIITPPPSFGSMAKELLEDIAIYARCQPITDMTNMREFDIRYLGSVARVVSTKVEATIFGDGASEDIDVRIADIKEAIKLEVSDLVIERLKDRVAKLEGKIALFRIGAPTDSAKEELEFRVEDAINTTRAAAQSGIVAGGGVTLLEVSKLPISDIYREALRSNLKQLLINANTRHITYRKWYEFWKPRVSVDISELLNAPVGYGINLRKSDDLVDIIKDGVIDAKLAAQQTIINATDSVATLITTDRVIIFEDEER